MTDNLFDHMDPTLLKYLLGSISDVGHSAKRVTAGLRSQVQGVGEDGKPEFNRHPGIVDEALGLPNLLPMLIKLSSQVNRKTGLHGYADSQDKVAKWLEEIMPEVIKQAPERSGRLRDSIHRQMGLSDPRGFQENTEEALGTMLGQLPIGAVKGGTSAGVKALKSLPEYLGPTIRPSVGNYGTGAVAGGIMGSMGESEQELTPEQEEAIHEMAKKYVSTGSLMGMAEGGMVNPQIPLANPDKVHDMQTTGSSPIIPVQIPHPDTWYNTYGMRPEHDWGTSGLPSAAQITGYANNSHPGSIPPEAAGSSPLTLQNILSAYKSGKSLYGTGKDIYNMIIGPDTSPTGQGVNPNMSYKGTTMNDQFSNPSSSNPGSSLTSTLGSGAVIGSGADLAASSALPAGQIVLSEVGDAAPLLGSTLGETSSLFGSGLSTLADTVPSLAVEGSAAGSTAANAASTTGSTLGTYGGPVLAVLGMLNMAFGDQAYGSHNVTGGPLLPGQEVKPIGDGAQSMLTTGSLGRGYGNDASKGSGQWFFTGDNHGQNGWFGRDDTTAMDKYMGQLTGIARGIQSGSAKQSPDGTYSMVSNVVGARGVPVPTRTTFNPTDGTITSNPVMADYMKVPSMYGKTYSIKNIYDRFGGQEGWGTDFNSWLGNSLGIFNNQGGSPSGSAAGGQVKSGYADGGKVDTLMKFLETLSMNPHATKGATKHLLEDPIENIKYAANEALSSGKYSQESHSDLSELMKKYLSGSSEISDENMADHLLDLHQALFGKFSGSVSPSEVSQLGSIPDDLGSLAKKYGGVIQYA